MDEEGEFLSFADEARYFLHQAPTLERELWAAGVPVNQIETVIKHWPYGASVGDVALLFHNPVREAEPKDALRFHWWRFGWAKPDLLIFGIGGWRHIWGSLWWRTSFIK
jgi:hypothetical protein